MLASVGDYDIRRDVLSTEIFLSRLSFDIISLIQGKEMGRHVTLNSCTVSAVSSFQGQNNQSFNVGEKVTVCPLSGLLKVIFSIKYVKACKYCISCWCNKPKIIMLFKPKMIVPVLWNRIPT